MVYGSRDPARASVSTLVKKTGSKASAASPREAAAKAQIVISEALLIFGLGDLVMLRQWIEQSEAGEERKRVEHQRLNALLGYCEGVGCRRTTLLASFDEVHPGHCGNCDNFHDATLAAIASAHPASLDALAGISGIGAKKLECYGENVLRVLESDD